MRRLEFFLIVGLLAGGATEAQADSATCMRLQQQYFAVDMQTMQDSFEIDRARAAYDNVREQARAAGCIGGFLFFKPKQSRQCPRIMARLRQVQADYARLGGGFNLLNFGRSDAEVARDRIRGALFAYGCDVPMSGGFRTVCVRSCDGYYFPINFAIDRNSFKRDAAICRGIYPDGKAELFVYQNPGQEADQMTSLDGEPYASKPYAFSYRSSYDPACASELSSGLAALAKAVNERHNSTGLLLPLPRPRPGRSVDPETLADEEGGLDLRAPATESKIEVSGLDAKTVRTVGPAYYYAAPMKIDSLGRKPAKPIGLPFIDSADAAEKPAVPEP